jgi:hypothetical protein
MESVTFKTPFALSLLIAAKAVSNSSGSRTLTSWQRSPSPGW